MKKWAGRCLAALRFLTIVPLPGSRGTSEEELAHATPFFPLVGLGLGLLSASAAWLLAPILPPLPGAVVLVALLAAFSGALHLDGLADSADGFFSSRPRERILEIMRDSRIGAMGVVALLLVVLLKVACLAALAPRDRITALLLMPLTGRCAILAMMALLPYARASSGGLASLFYQREVRTTAGCSLLLLAAVGGLAGGTRGMMGLAVAAVTILVFSFYCRKKIGGATGDTLGAVCELAETGFALGFCLTLWKH